MEAVKRSAPIANRLGAVLEEHDEMTQKALADRVGVASTYVSNIVCGVRPLSLNLGVDILRVLREDYETDVVLLDLWELPEDVRNGTRS